MALIDLFLEKREVISETKENADVVDDLILKKLLSGQNLTSDDALSIPAISSAVDLLSNMVSMLPIKLYRSEVIDGNKKVTEVLDDKRLYLLNIDTMDLLDPFQMKKAIVHDYLVEKGAYVFIDKKKNTVNSLRYIDPIHVHFQSNFDPIYKDVKYSVDAKEYESYQFITILRRTKDGIKSVSAIEEITKSIETAFSTILYELGLVKKGGAKKGFLVSERKLGSEELKALKDAWNKYFGSNNEESAIVLNNGLKFQEASSSSVELQINERKKTLKDDIKDVFHIHDDYNNTIKFGVMPIISAIETALNKNLLLESEKGSFYFAFDTKNITRGSLKERYEAYKIASDTGWISKNEIRNAEDYDSVDGLDVISMTLADVLYDTKNRTYFTPNTGSIIDLEKGGDTNENSSEK